MCTGLRKVRGARAVKTVGATASRAMEATFNMLRCVLDDSEGKNRSISLGKRARNASLLSERIRQFLANSQVTVSLVLGSR